MNLLSVRMYIYIYMWEASQDVLHLPKGYSSTLGVLPGVPLRGNTWATTRIGERHSAIRGGAPRSGFLLLRRDLTFELVNTVVNEVRKRAFSARS